MLYNLFNLYYFDIVTVLSILFAFIGTFLVTKYCQAVLPKDQGRAFAVNGKVSQGKPRGAGILFVLTFSAVALLFVPFKVEFLIYIVLIIAAMISGFLDDSSKSPWGEYKKGLIDLVLAAAVAYTYVYFNGTTFTLLYSFPTVTIPTWLFMILAIILVWVSINVTNCTDGVDGLSGTLSLITLITMYGICYRKGMDSSFMQMILIFCGCILAYLWFNASPSKLLMGDAGSRAIGFFIAICAMKSGSPLLYIPAAIVIIIDGGIGLVKVFLLRFLKIRILKNTRTPLHDHARKNKQWSDAQVVLRFAILQLVVSLALLFA